MSLRLQSPEALWLLLAAVPAVLVAIRFFTSMSPWRRGSAALARVVLIAVIVGALAGASSVRVSDRLAVVAVIDVSASSRSYAGVTIPNPSGEPERVGVVAAAKAFLAHADGVRGPEDLLGVVVFDGRSMAIASPTRGDASARTIDLTSADGTNIEQGMRLAASMIPPGAAGRLLLVSDGVETSGNALDAASDLAGTSEGRSRIPVDVSPLAYAVENEVVVESLDVPARAAARSTITARIVLNATDAARGRLFLLRDGEPLDINGRDPGLGRSLDLPKGRSAELVTLVLDQGRLHRFEARFEPESGDTNAANNSAEGFVLTPDAGAVLIADGVGGGDPDAPGATLARALEASGITVLLRPPEGLPESMLDLQAFDAVFLQNVPADGVSETTQALLVEYVRDLGGGLVMIGGPDSFGAGGWRGSLLEPLLPVALDVPDRIVVPETAIVFILDNSGSMRRGVLGSSRSQQQIANEAAALAVRSLDDRDLIGVVTFNSAPSLLAPLSGNDDPDRLVKKLLAIGSGGGTNLVPALEMAREQLSNAQAKSKHVIVLSDGRSSDQEQLSPLARAMADEGIRVSSIAVGDQADAETMQEMATVGGGHFYNVLNPSMLPRIFVKAVRVVRSPLIREGIFAPLVIDASSPLVQGIDSMPNLSGLVLTRPRPEPSIVNAIADPAGEPVLAHWNVELGQVVAFTSDAHRWASAWVDWPGYVRFWSQIARRVARSASASGMSMSVEPVDDELRIRLDAADPSGRPIDLLSIDAAVYPPRGPAREITLSQVGPGIYAGSTPAREAGSYVVIAKPRSGATRLPPVLGGGSVGSSVEGRALSSNVRLLKQIAERTGGRLIEPESLASSNPFVRDGARPSEARSPLWRALIAWSLLVFMLDVGTRRIAWDRFVSKRFGAGLHAAAMESVARRDEAAVRATSALKAHAKEPEPEAALGEVDARRVALEQAEARRRATRERIEAVRAEQARQSAASQPAPATPTPARQRASAPPQPPATAPEAGDLLAAKRRARERFMDHPTEPEA